MNLEVQFLSSLMSNPYLINTIDQAVSALDFVDKKHYKIYLRIMDFLIEGKDASYPDLRFKFREDETILSIIDEMEKTTAIDLKTVYSAMISDTRRQNIGQLVKDAGIWVDEGRDVDEIQNNLDAELIRIKSKANMKLESVSSIESELLDNINERIRLLKETGTAIKLPTGIDKLDELTLGLHKKNIWVIAASTSDGKTQLAVQFANSIIKNEKALIYFLLEDEKELLLYRFISLNTGITLSKIRSGNLNDAEVRKIGGCLDNLKRGDNLFVDDTTYVLEDLVAKVKFAKIKYPNLQMIVVDYISLLIVLGKKFGSREQELSYTSKRLLALSKECDIAVLVLAQLNTSPDDRSSGMPIKMNDIRDSKAIGHDASVCLFLYYPLKYKQTKEQKYSKEWCQLILAKNRYGEVNKVIDLTNMASVARFKEGLPKKFKDDVK